MAVAYKGLMKGLRYMTSMFSMKTEQEPEIQIGGPTDVKHVAHIGWDGPTANAPSWMDKFKEGEGEGGEGGAPEGGSAVAAETKPRSKGGKTSRKKKAKGASASGGAKAGAKAKNATSSVPENDLQGG